MKCLPPDICCHSRRRVHPHRYGLSPQVSASKGILQILGNGAISGPVSAGIFYALALTDRRLYSGRGSARDLYRVWPHMHNSWNSGTRRRAYNIPANESDIAGSDRAGPAKLQRAYAALFYQGVHEYPDLLACAALWRGRYWATTPPGPGYNSLNHERKPLDSSYTEWITQNLSAR